MKTLPKRVTPGAAALLLVAVFVYSVWSFVGWNPKYRQDRLINLTYQEVIERCGTPYFDPRSQPSWREGVDGPLAISYVGPFGQTYVIYFSNGKVSKVEHFFK
jgi:hypothetical protein